MKEIKLLDNITINKIAAGEVVERPSSVVKELVENSIDSGASVIAVEIQNGGTTLIRITDNGCGIPKNDVKTAFLRHATSKISAVEDLESIFSLGFRGEALASIASVSQMSMITKTTLEDIGTKIEINGGELISMQDASALGGTVIEVRNIFYNVPARRKFLKKVATESGYISDIINKIVLGHPEISFEFINNNTVILHTSGNSDLKTVAYHVYGKDLTSKLIDIDNRKDELHITGVCGKPELSRANRSYENLFINGRFIKNTIVSSAVEAAYKTRLMIGKFPVYIINLSMPPSMVDVNVHPSKLEVRFVDENEIYSFIYESIIKTFKDKVLIPEADWNSKPSDKVNDFLNVKDCALDAKPKIKSSPMGSVTNEARIFMSEFKDESQAQNPYNEAFITKPSQLIERRQAPKTLYVSDTRAEYDTSGIDNGIVTTAKPKAQNQQSFDEPSGEKMFFNNYKIIGQIFNTYWIVEQSGSIYMIDQHAAHERILFEELMNRFKTEDVVSQRLLQPIALRLSETETVVLKENKDLFSKFGFDVEEFGIDVFALQSVPFIFNEHSDAEFFMDILDTLQTTNMESLFDAKTISIATMACKAAVKANDKLSAEEAKTLIERLLKLDNPFNCPHGRPTVIEMTKYELEKKFKRIQ